jgi:MOSC domain-containing protein YiiM
VPALPAGAVRANIETLGINLVALTGRHIRIGDAVLLLYEPRSPCSKMDALAPGLRELMRHNRQGMMAEVIQSGRIQVGDEIAPGEVPLRQGA